MGILDEMPPQQELEFPVVLPNGATAYCKVDEHGRIDPRKAYAPWLALRPRAIGPDQRGADRED